MSTVRSHVRVLGDTVAILSRGTGSMMRYLVWYRLPYLGPSSYSESSSTPGATRFGLKLEVSERIVIVWFGSDRDEPRQ